ncbi:MAG: hypothetical protein KIG65_00465 [Eubacteriales bacterium]|nr:hypothetical protein [Eubacteriales bacterium]
MDKILKRSDKLAFYEIDGTYKRMRGFTDFSVSKNPTAYTRKYVDEQSERNDVVGYNPSITFAFDRFSDDAVHSDMVSIADTEAVGADAVRSIVIVDITKETENGYFAQKRDFAVIPDSEGNDSDTYTYSGSLKANGAIVTGYAQTSDNWQTVTFAEE